MDSTVLSKLVIGAAEIVAHSLGSDIQPVSNLADRSIGQTVLDAAQVVESDGFCRDLVSVWGGE